MNCIKTSIIKILYYFGYEIRVYRVDHEMHLAASKFGCSVRKDKKAGTIEITKTSEQKKIIIAAAHAIYDATIWESFDHYFVAVLPEKRGDYLVVDYSKPKIHRLAPDGLQFEFTSFAENMHSLAESYFQKYKPAPGDVIFDCGAYCGDSAYIFSKAVGPTGKVFAFEPDAMSYQALLRNIERHNLTNVIAVQKGIWSHPTRIKLVADGTLGSVVTDVGVRDTKAPSTEIDVTSIPEAYTEFGLDRLNFVKIDIEGAEIEAVEGAIQFLKEHDVHFAVESHRRDGKQTCERVSQMLRRAGYLVETRKYTTKDGDDAGIFTWAWPRRRARLGLSKTGLNGSSSTGELFERTVRRTMEFAEFEQGRINKKPRTNGKSSQNGSSTENSEQLRKNQLGIALAPAEIEPDRFAPEADATIPDFDAYSPQFSPWLVPEFVEIYQKVEPHTLVSPDRCYTLLALALQAMNLDGEFWECGVYRGGTAMLLSDLLADKNRVLRLFDTFEGMPVTDARVDPHKQGDFCDTSVDSVASRVTGNHVRFHKGRIPETFADLDDAKIAFAHVDVDIYKSVRDCCEFVFPRLAVGGFIVFDDYGFTSCPGARLAVDEYFSGKPVVPIVLPGGQAIVFKSS